MVAPIVFTEEYALQPIEFNALTFAATRLFNTKLNGLALSSVIGIVQDKAATIPLSAPLHEVAELNVVPSLFLIWISYAVIVYPFVVGAVQVITILVPD